MMKINRWWLVIIFIGVVGLAVGLVALMTQPAARTCQPRNDDTQGYLFKICTYIQQKQLNVSPGDPTSYHIKQIEEREENGRAVIWIFLDCCYMGDIAVIDKASGQVIEFHPSPQ